MFHSVTKVTTNLTTCWCYPFSNLVHVPCSMCGSTTIWFCVFRNHKSSTKRIKIPALQAATTKIYFAHCWTYFQSNSLRRSESVFSLSHFFLSLLLNCIRAVLLHWWRAILCRFIFRYICDACIALFCFIHIFLF